MSRTAVSLIIVSLLVVGYVVVSGIMARFESSMQELAATPLQEVDLARIPDGTYTGSFTVLPVSAEVTVVVENGTLADIELVKHGHGRGAQAEVIPSRVIDAQSLAVDAVSGATYSSQVILRAIEDALVNAAGR